MPAPDAITCRQARQADRHAPVPDPPRRPRRGRPRRRSAARPRRPPARRGGAHPRCSRAARGHARRARSSSSAPRATGAARASPPCSRSAGLPAEYLEGGQAAWVAAGLPLVDPGKITARDADGRSRLGDALAAQDRPHRLPLADPPLRRSARGLPLRRARGGRGRGRAVRRDALRHRGGVLEPSRRALHLRHDARRVRARDARARSAGLHRPRRRHGAARPRARGCGAARRLPRPLAHVRRRPRAARGRHGALRRLLPLGARRHRRDPQLADQPAGAQMRAR